MIPRVIAQRFLPAQTSVRFFGCLVALLAGVLLILPQATAQAPTLTLTPSSVTFSSIVVNTTATTAVTVKNTSTGSNPITFTSIVASGSNYFSQTNTCTSGNLGAGKTCAITVSFTPAKIGTFTGTITLTDNATGSPQKVSLSGTAIQGGTINVIQHIVFIVKENRSFDNYFGTFPGADGATSGKVSNGSTLTLGHTPDRTKHDIDHSWRGAILAIDGGKMDKFDLIGGGNVRGEFLAYSQHVERDIPNYWTYARTFVLADRMFSSLTGPSFPNHLYTVGAQSGGAINNPNKTKGSWGCDSDDGALVQVMDERGTITQQFPCFDFQTVADSLETAHITWKYYAPRYGEGGY